MYRKDSRRCLIYTHYGEKPDYTGEEPAKKSNTWIPVVISITAVAFIATAAVVIVIRKKASYSENN